MVLGFLSLLLMIMRMILMVIVSRVGLTWLTPCHIYWYYNIIYFLVAPLLSKSMTPLHSPIPHAAPQSLSGNDFYSAKTASN